MHTGCAISHCSFADSKAMLSRLKIGDSTTMLKIKNLVSNLLKFKYPFQDLIIGFDI